MKLKKGMLIILILSIIITFGNIAQIVYKLITKNLDTTTLISNSLMIIVMVTMIFLCFEKKDK